MEDEEEMRVFEWGRFKIKLFDMPQPSGCSLADSHYYICMEVYVDDHMVLGKDYARIGVPIRCSIDGVDAIDACLMWASVATEGEKRQSAPYSEWFNSEECEELLKIRYYVSDMLDEIGESRKRVASKWLCCTSRNHEYIDCASCRERFLASRES